jgi:hypothetical protein
MKTSVIFFKMFSRIKKIRFRFCFPPVCKIYSTVHALLHAHMHASMHILYICIHILYCVNSVSVLELHNFISACMFVNINAKLHAQHYTKICNFVYTWLHILKALDIHITAHSIQTQWARIQDCINEVHASY